MIIYKTTNLVNNKLYVGKSIYTDSNYYGSGIVLKVAIKKYGKNNFKKEILEKCVDELHLNEREKYWINKTNAINRDVGYNIAEGGTGGKTTSKPWNFGLKTGPLSEEQKIKQSKVMKEKYKNMEIINPMVGKTPWNKGLTKKNK